MFFVSFLGVRKFRDFRKSNKKTLVFELHDTQGFVSEIPLKTTKIISLSGNIKRAGAIEITMGSSLGSVINSIGGGPIDGGLSAVAVGGPSSGIIPVERINEVIISPGLIDGHAVMVGAGGVIPLGKDTNVLQEIHQLSEYNASESCGK